MADNYTELQAEILSWLDRDDADLVAAVPDMIAAAEDFLEQDIAHWKRESEQTFPVDPGGEYTPPADFYGVVLLSKNGTDIELVYNQKLERLSGTVADNWLLLENDSLYRYASLAQAESWLKNDPRIVVWSQIAKEQVESMNRQGHGQPSGDTRADKRPFRAAMLQGSDGWIDYVSPAEAMDIVRSGMEIADNGGRQVYSLWAGKLRVVPAS